MTHRAGPVPITVNGTGPGTLLPLTGDQVAGLLRVPGLVRPHPGSAPTPTPTSYASATPFAAQPSPGRTVGTGRHQPVRPVWPR